MEKSKRLAIMNYDLPKEFNLIEITPGQKIDYQLLESVGQLRSLVWKDYDIKMKADSISKAGWIDKEDFSSFIWAILKDDVIVAIARMTLHKEIIELPDSFLYAGVENAYPCPVASFNRLLVTPAFRKKGWVRF